MKYMVTINFVWYLIGDKYELANRADLTCFNYFYFCDLFEFIID